MPATKFYVVALVLSLLVFVVVAANPLANARTAAQKIVAKLTLAQQLSLVHGLTPHVYVGETVAIPEAGIPALHLQDGPQVRRTSAPTSSSPTSPSLSAPVAE